MNIPDGDHILTDGAAWLEIGRFAIRIRKTTAGDGVGVEVYESGKEFNEPVDQCWVFESDIGE